jgi:hypothetical protein
MRTVRLNLTGSNPARPRAFVYLRGRDPLDDSMSVRVDGRLARLVTTAFVRDTFLGLYSPRTRLKEVRR